MPANRVGHQAYTAAELKTFLEVITLTAFLLTSEWLIREALVDLSAIPRAPDGPLSLGRGLW